MLYYHSLLGTTLFNTHPKLYQNFIQTYSVPICLLSPIHTDDFLADKDKHLPQLKAWIASLNLYIDTLIREQTTHTLCQKNSLLPTLLQFRAAIIDSILIALFHHLNLTGATLFAIGGYARTELFCQSDIDLLILHNHPDSLENEPNAEPLIALESFVALLWDLGISPAVRIHHISDDTCVKDHTIATSVLENRWLAGNTGFQGIPKDWLTKHYTPATFFDVKYQEYTARHQKNDYNEYVLEPNIKESVGGLRDVHFLHWIAKFYFQLPPDITLQALVDKGFLSQNECDELIYAKHFLWLVRHHLHTLEQKDNNKLSFGMQKTLSKLLHYPDSEHNPNHAPEHLMKDYYRAVMTIASLSTMLGQLFFGKFLGECLKTPLTDHYHLAHSKFGEQLGINDDTLFQQTPSELLNVFLLMGEYGIKRLTPTTLRALRNHRHLIDQDFLDNRHHRALFLENLDEPNYLFHRLRLMKQTGILGAYLPDFHKIIGLSQYDLFHDYTVDAHTLMLIRMLHRFYRDDFGLLSTVYKEIDNPLIMVIAAIFHDIAKGRQGDHSELGADLVAEFCHTHAINAKDSELAEWLVRHHLVMSVTAQKKDIYDPDVIADFAKFVGDVRHLDYLYVLTVADMNATNSQLWNNWRASLLKQLYLSTHAKFDQNSDTSPKAIISQKKQAVLAKIENKPAIETFWQGLPDAYFLRQSKSEMLWHAQARLAHTDDSPLVKVIPHKNKSLHAHKLFIYTPNVSNLFALTVVILDKFGFAVYTADILTDSRDFALDTYVIVDKELANKSIVSPKSPMISHGGHLDTMVLALTEHLKNPAAFFAKNSLSSRYASDKLKHFDIKTQVFFEKNDDTSHNLHIITKDRPSLLAKIGQSFGELGIWVYSAKITTLGERAEDVFCVGESGGGALSLPRQEAIKAKLLTILG